MNEQSMIDNQANQIRNNNIRKANQRGYIGTENNSTGASKNKFETRTETRSCSQADLDIIDLQLDTNSSGKASSLKKLDLKSEHNESKINELDFAQLKETDEKQMNKKTLNRVWKRGKFGPSKVIRKTLCIR